MTNFTSANLFSKLNLLSQPELEKINLGFKWIQSNLDQYVIVGGVAVVSYTSGNRVLTPDLDIMVNDIDLVKKKLEDQGLKSSNLTNGLGVMVEEYNLDILDTQTGNKVLNKLILNKSNHHEIYGQPFKIIEPELLTILKLELGRTKDLEDGLMLLQSGLNRTKYKNYIEQLKDVLNEYESLISYSSMIN